MITAFRRSLLIGFVMTTLVGCLAQHGTDTDPAVSRQATSSFANNSPIISGSPPSAVTIGNNYYFRPTASDPDGDSLLFSIDNLPAWAWFDTNTGELSGQPLLGSDGRYRSIVIRVSDGHLSSSIGPFSIEVSEGRLGSIRLEWEPPIENIDGSPLVDLAGYKIYYGLAPSQYTVTIALNDAAQTTHVIDNLVPGTYYVAATAINSVGQESGLSNETRLVAN